MPQPGVTEHTHFGFTPLSVALDQHLELHLLAACQKRSRVVSREKGYKNSDEAREKEKVRVKNKMKQKVR